MNILANKREYINRTRELFRISMPIILEQVFITMMGTVNTMLVSSVGEHAVSAVGMIDSVSNLVIALFAALTTGGTIVVAQYIGRRDAANASNAAAQSIFLSFSLSVIIFAFFSVFKNQTIRFLYSNADGNVIEAAMVYLGIINFSYPVLAVMQTVFGILRGSGNTRTPMIITIIMNIMNVLLGVILILGLNINVFGFFTIRTPGYGVAGAALALTLSRLSGLLMGFFYILKYSKVIRFNSLHMFKPNLSIQKIVLRLGVPTSVESSLFQVGKLITQIFIVSMGTAAIAANSISSSIANMINVPGSSFSTGVMILVGQRIGRGDEDDVKKTTYFAVLMGMVMLGTLCLVAFPLTGIITGAYNPSEQSSAYLRQILYTLYIATPLFWPVSFITPAALRATGDVKYTMVVAILSMALIRVVLGYVLGIYLHWGLIGVWVGMYADWIVRGLFFFTRLRGDKWKNKGVR